MRRNHHWTKEVRKALRFNRDGSSHQRPCLTQIVDDLITMIFLSHLRKMIKEKLRLLQSMLCPCCSTSQVQSFREQSTTTVESETVLKCRSTREVDLTASWKASRQHRHWQLCSDKKRARQSFCGVCNPVLLPDSQAFKTPEWKRPNITHLHIFSLTPSSVSVINSNRLLSCTLNYFIQL